MADRIDDVIDSKKIIAELNNVYTAMSKVASLIITINSIAQNTNFANFKQGFQYLAQMQANLAALNAAKTNAINQEAALKAALLQSQTAYQNLKNQIAQLTLAQKQAAAQNRNNNKAEAGSIIDLRNQLRKLIQLWDSYGPATRKANMQTLEDIKRIEAELKKLEGETGRFQRNVGNYPQVTQLVGGLKGLLGQFGVALGAGAIAKEIFDTSVKVDSLNAGLKAVSGSTEELVINQKFLREEGERLGLNVLDLTNSYKLFYAASTQSGLNADTTRKIFNSVAESAANLRLSTDNTNGVLLAFSQILGKGKVQAEELRGQIGERVPGAFHIAAKSIGVTEQELDKMLKKGEVIASDFLPKFAAELEKTFGVDDEKRVEGLQSSINRLSNSFTDLVNNNQSALSKFFTLFIDLAREALVSVNNLLGGVTYLSLKLTDKNAAQDFLNAKALDEYSEKLKKLNAGDLLSQRNNVDQRTEQVENRLQGNLATIKSIRDAYGKNADTVYGAFIARTEKIVAEDQATLKLLEGQRTALIAELKKRFPATGTGVDTTAAAKGPTKSELDQAARIREQEIKAQAEARKKELQLQIDAQKDILENDKNSFADRMAANEQYIDLKGQLAQVDAKKEKDILEVRVGRNKATAKEVEAIEADLQYQLGQNVREGGKNLTKILADNADERMKGILSAFENEKQGLQKQANDELAVVQDLYKKRRITKEQYEAEELRIANEFGIKELQAEIQAQEAILEIMKQQGVPVADQEAKIKELKNKVYDLDLDYFKETEKQKTKDLEKQLETRKQLEAEYNDKVKQLRQDALDFTGEIGNIFFERQKNNVQEEIDLISQRSEAEIKAVEQSTLSTQEKADKEAAINLQAQAQKEALERRQRDIDVKAATFQKFMSLLQIGITTAESVFKIQAQAAILASNPITAALAGLAYAQIPIVIAGGALQAAAIAAKPIPKYRTGRHGGRAELGITGDGGVHEVLASPDGRQAMITPNKDTLTYIPAGWDVHPSVDDYLRAATWGAYSKAPVITGDPNSVDKLVKAVNDSMREHSEKISRTIEENKNEFHFHNGWDGVQFTQKKLNQRQRRIDRDIFGRF